MLGSQFFWSDISDDIIGYMCIPRMKFISIIQNFYKVQMFIWEGTVNDCVVNDFLLGVFQTEAGDSQLNFLITFYP